MKLPVDTGRKLNVHKTFKRRPGRLLSVICTFNLGLQGWLIQLNYCPKILDVLWKIELSLLKKSYTQNCL